MGPLRVLADGLEVLLGVGPAGDGHHLFGDKRGRLLEVSRGRELLGELARVDSHRGTGHA